MGVVMVVWQWCAVLNRAVLYNLYITAWQQAILLVSAHAYALLLLCCS